MESLFRKQLMFALVALVLCGVSILGLFRFANEMKVKQNKVLEARQRLVSYEHNKKIYAEESIVLKELEKKVGALEVHRITSEGVPQFLSSLETKARAHTVAFTITNAQLPKNGESAKKFTIDFSAKGSSENIFSFLTTLQSQPYEIRFTRFSFSEIGSGGGETPASKEPVWEVLATIEIISF